MDVCATANGGCVCATDASGCGPACAINADGDPTCSCAAGYVLGSDLKTCTLDVRRLARRLVQKLGGLFVGA